jgi:hypothetical protein
VRKALLLSLLVLIGGLTFATQFVVLSATPTYLLPGGSVKFVATLLSTTDVKTILLKLQSDNSTTTLYNPTNSGKNYTWTYVTPTTPSDFKVWAEVTFYSTSSKTTSNIATFTTDIPAASVESTIVYVPFISNATQTWNVKIANIGSKPLEFTTYSSPNTLEISPCSGEISSGESKELTITKNAFLLPGSIHILDAYVNTNDPRPNMKKRLLIRILEGPNGLVVSPIVVSHTRVSVGSDVNFKFSVFHDGVTLESVNVIWERPQGVKSFYYSSNKTYFSSDLRLARVGTYKLSTIMITYVDKNTRKQLIMHPNITVTAYASSKYMDLKIEKDAVKVNITSQTTPTLHAVDSETDEILDLTHASSDTWDTTYEYLKKAGSVTLYATFSDTNYVISKTFNRYIANSLMTNFSFNDEGWITIQKETFPSTAMMVLFSESTDENSYYKGYQPFTPVSNIVTVVSDSTPLKDFTYHLRFDLAMVNGLFDKLHVYEEKDGKWLSDPATLTVLQGQAMTAFNEKDGTYTVGISPNVQPSSKPLIKAFVIMPRKSTGTKIQFFLAVNEDCHYRLEIYDMRSRIVKMQTGQAVGNLNTLVYTLDPYSLPNGLYVAVIGVGNTANAVTSSLSKSFTIVK